jgi:hypothetical protein
MPLSGRPPRSPFLASFRFADHPGRYRPISSRLSPALRDQYRRPRGVSDGRAHWVVDRRSGVPGGAWNILALQSRRGASKSVVSSSRRYPEFAVSHARRTSFTISICSARRSSCCARARASASLRRAPYRCPLNSLPLASSHWPCPVAASLFTS